MQFSVFIGGPSILLITQANDFGDLSAYILFLITIHADQSSSRVNSNLYFYCCSLIQALVKVNLPILKDLDLFSILSPVISCQGIVPISKYKLNLSIHGFKSLNISS